MTNLQYLTLLLSWLMLAKFLSSEPIPYSINTKKWSHVLDDHFISITINPTDILQGRAFGLGMNSTLEILKGLSPAYIRLGSADTNKYTFRNSRYANDVVRTGDELIFTEAHWVALNEAAKAAGLDIIVCLNAAHRNEGTNKWDTRNSLELISFSESQGYNLTFQLGYEVQKTEDLSGIQFGKDLNRLRTLLNAFPRYQNSKLIGPDIKVLHKKDDIDFVNDVLIEAGPTLDAVTWHPRWPQPSKMKVSDISELGYEFPADYLDYDRTQLNKILQRSIFKNPVWIGEPKSESTGTFAEGLLWARRLMLAAKQGIEVVMKHPTLMDISHPKPEYWIALLHKKLLGKSVLDTRPLSSNHSDISVITHCTNSQYLTDKQEKPQDGSVTVYAVNMGGIDQKIQIRGTVTGKLQNIYQFVLTAGSDPDAVFSQMTYLNGEPLMMTDEGLLPELTPRIKKIERSVTLKLPAYSVGFWVIPEAKVRICQMQPVTIPTINLDTLSPANMIKNTQKGLQSIRNINEFLVEKLKNPVNSEEESYSVESGPANSIESDERGTVKEKRHSHRHRRQVSMDDIALELRKNLDDIRGIFELGRDKNTFRESNLSPEHHAHFRAAQEKIDSLTNEMSTAIRMSNQEEEFGRFLEKAGLKEDFGNLMMKEKGVGSGYPPKNIWGRVRREVDNEQPDSQDEENPITVGGKLNVRGLEERYKTLFSNQVQKGIRKIDEMKHKIKKEDIKIPLSVPENIQEEILLKEIEVLEKTEETMTELMRNHKKRQEALEEIIKEEIHDIKEERLMALEEVRNHKKGRDTPKKAHHSKKNKETKETVEETDDKTTNKRETNDDKDDGEDDEDKGKSDIIRKFIIKKGGRAKEKLDLRNKLRESYNRITKKNKKEKKEEEPKEEEKAEDESKSEEKEAEEESVEVTVKPIEHVPLKKNDESRRTDVLEQIGKLVEKMSAKNKKKEEDMSEEEFDMEAKNTKRKPRKIEKKEAEGEEAGVKNPRERLREKIKEQKKLESGEAGKKATPLLSQKLGDKEALEIEDISLSAESPETPKLTEAVVTVTEPPQIQETTQTLQRTKREIDDDDHDDSSSEEFENLREKIMKRKMQHESANDIPKSDPKSDNIFMKAKSAAQGMVDDIFSEAYDQTTQKIRTLGISEYFGELSKFLEQFKNLDQMFSIIGNFLNGEENGKSQHVQTIRRNKRQVQEEAVIEPTPVVTNEEYQEDLKSPLAENSETDHGVDGGRVMADGEKNNENPAQSEQEIVERPVEGEQIPIEVSPEQVAIEEAITAQPNFIQETTTAEPDVEDSEEFYKITKTGRRIPIRRKRPDREELLKHLRDNHVNKYQKSEPEMEPPWIRSTKEFIQHAMSALHRQKELSEIVTRETLNDLVKREIARKIIGKREAIDDGSHESIVKRQVYPLYRLPEANPAYRLPESNRKREAIAQESPRYLSELQPGVYVVPTKDMENIRSEQVVKEEAKKPGQPNVVTLNIYYDRKSEQQQSTPAPVAPVQHYYQSYQPPPPPQPHYTSANYQPQYIPPPPETRYQPQYAYKGPSYPSHKTYHRSEPAQTVYHAPEPAQPVYHAPEPAQPAYHAQEPAQPAYHAQEPAQPSYHAQEPAQPAYHAPEPAQPAYHAPEPAQPAYQAPETQHPVYETVYAQPSESKWSEYKPPLAANHIATDPGWDIQYETKTKKNFDKRRSISNGKFDPNMLESALPFWKYFESYKNSHRDSSEETTESNSTENLFEENRKRQQQQTEVKIPEVQQSVEGEEEEEETDRQKRSVRTSNKNQIPGHKRSKRSILFDSDEYGVIIVPSETSDVPELINARLIDNDDVQLLFSNHLDNYEDDSEDNEDHEFLLENVVPKGRLYRQRRSTEDLEKMLKSNIIQKIPLDHNKVQHEILTKKGKILKKLTDEDSSLEVPKVNHSNVMKPGEKKEEKDIFADFVNYAYESMLSFMKKFSELF